MPEPTDYVLAYDFTEGTGTTVHDKGPNGDDLTIAGTGGQWVTTALPGLAATGYRFSRAGDGRAETLVTGGNLFGSSKEYTVAVLAILDPEDRDPTFLVAPSEGDDQVAVVGQIQPWDDGRVWAGHANGSNYREVAASLSLLEDIDPDLPHWWVVTATDIGNNRVRIRLWLDGHVVAAGNRTADADAVDVDRFCVANFHGGGENRGCNATVFVVRVYDYDLTSDEIAELGVTASNAAPVADAGADQTVNAGAVVTLDASGSSDVETAFEDLTFAWTVSDADGTGLTTGDLEGADQAVCTFTAPAVSSQANIVIQLQVTDEDGSSDTDTVTITVDPVADDLFPVAKLPVTLELLLDGVWTDITDYWRVVDGIQFSHGRQDWRAQVTAGRATLTLDNSDGRFSPRNPESPYYGALGRNTQIRCTVERANVYRRFWHEVPEWPVAWDPSGADVNVQIRTAGILRRLEANTDPVHSVLRREIPQRLDNLVAYWPLEDAAGPNRRRFSSGLEGGEQMRIVSDARPDFAAYDGFDCSAALPTMNNADIRGDVAFYRYESGKANLQFGFLLHVPDGGSTTGQTLIHINTSATATQWEVRYNEDNDGTLQLRCRDVNNTEILNSGDLHTGIDGRNLWVLVQLKRAKNETAIDYTMHVFDVGGDPEGDDAGGSLATTRGLGRAETVTINYDGGHETPGVGHVTVQSQISSPTALVEALAAYRGEAAGRRIERLCAEAGVPCTIIGDPDDTEPMGPQRVGTFLQLIRECVDVDGGLLMEGGTGVVGSDVDVFGLVYRTRRTLENQDAAITTGYGDSTIAVDPGLQPVDDDQDLRNDVTVAAPAGASARYEVTEGPLSVQAPPDGVGRYQDAVELNALEGRLRALAGWRAHRGTVDEARWPMVPFKLESPAVVGDADLTHQILSARLGDRITIDDLPDWLPPDDISVLIEGADELIGDRQHHVTFVCSPEAPWRVGRYGTARADTSGSELAEDLTTTETGVTVNITAGPLWTTTNEPFDIIVGGERMTVTAVTGASSPQTFTVTRSVNGVVKTHSTGEPVRLYQPAYYAL